MSPRNLFVADSHCSHRATLVGGRLGLNRPFSTIEELDEALIARWNAAVRPQDTVWHLGDVFYRCPEARARAREIFSRLNGRRFLARGNHDRIGERMPWDGPVVDVARVHTGPARPAAAATRRTDRASGAHRGPFAFSGEPRNFDGWAQIRTSGGIGLEWPSNE